MTLSPAPFYFVRHGQTDWNLVRKLQGNTDIELNETGIAQAHQAKTLLAECNIKSICTSPLKRARKTAEIINQNFHCPIIELDDLRELNFGASEGSEYFPWLKELFRGDITNVPHDVEPLTQFLLRCKNAINTAIEQPGPILIVAHGGTYLPANNTLAPDDRHSLQNCQPVRHDPPKIKGGYWQKTHLC